MTELPMSIKTGKERLNFFIKNYAAGSFRGNAYPSEPGRYRYSPYRGWGHVLRALEKGKKADCWFRKARRYYEIEITKQEFVVTDLGCKWFVMVSRIQESEHQIRIEVET
jgi:hypothetical protein